MTRKCVLKQIDSLIDGTCGNCPVRDQFYKSKKDRGKFSILDSFCVKQCETGNQLRQLGQVLMTL